MVLSCMLPMCQNERYSKKACRDFPALFTRKQKSWIFIFIATGQFLLYSFVHIIIHNATATNALIMKNRCLS